jgi:nucleotide-binding universal stress UspA family protein
MKILLAVDGSEYSLTAAEIIASRPWPPGSTIKALCVVRLPFTPSAETRALPDSDYSRLERAAMEEARTAVDAALARINENSVPGEAAPYVTSDIILGQPQETVLEEADRWGADLIVLGSRGLGGFKRFLLGSVSTAVATHAHCSVEIARADEAHPIRKSHLKILLAVDGSAGSDAAIRAVLARSWPEGSAVKILGAAEPPQPLTPKSWAMPGNYYQEWEKSLEDQARAAVEKAAVQLAGMALTVLPEVIKGQARDVILNAAENWGADLIVLGSRGLGGFERLLLGSVSHAVVTHAHCSVKIVRERQTTD